MWFIVEASTFRRIAKLSLIHTMAVHRPNGYFHLGSRKLSASVFMYTVLDSHARVSPDSHFSYSVSFFLENASKLFGMKKWLAEMIEFEVGAQSILKG